MAHAKPTKYSNPYYKYIQFLLNYYKAKPGDLLSYLLADEHHILKFEPQGYEWKERTLISFLKTYHAL